MPTYCYHIIAFFAGFVLDCILGDPYCFPHPVRLIGKLISSLENKYLGPKPPRNEMPETTDEATDETPQKEMTETASEEAIPPTASEEVTKKETEPSALSPEAKKKREQGRTTVLIVLLCTVAVTDIIFWGSYYLHPILGCVTETILTYQILAAKCLCVESMKVYKALKTGPIENARKAVSMIVGRDTDQLDEAGVTRAAVETVAENTSDGVIAPMLYLAIGGPILGMLYKAINTMDSMIGYKNERYLDFGRAAAKLDDVVNFLPSRISAWLMIFACPFLGDHFIASEGKRIYLRDRRKHASPNSAQTESVCAGALGIQLAGDASYFGKLVHKPTIGDGRRKVNPEDIRLTNRLMYGATILCLLLCIALMALACYFFFGGNEYWHLLMLK
jgi:adenosylcobinamide-phosphate synthase